MKEEQPSIPLTHSCSHPCIFQESRGPDPMLPTGFNAGLLDSLGGDNSRPGSRISLTALIAVSRGGVSNNI